ncbi:uncharacterized protein LOC123543143 [Mercenaria mercenaria]|uniref:uncharacterized protein LOC123543143 n=1 Tax=Mercenaria mercenaria TaxID=6596 RepID=UPI00234F7E88|nr:uncharacterized protein LOC123543143 [Mercenaria mercenaria]XP_053386818.1 uncharacterized protein LOC123543143 [Mercenaria mercenaria]XP_053386819.1 uncharacterized protein LOC123543143 [Mercenaria mercenaria]XP_053386821.1 uncharacterized protein LOC123543143 [Mercenaria mercenaria]
MTFQYNFGHKYRGRALIIGNQFIWKNAKGKDVIGRKGCAKDLEMMEELFLRLDFKVTICRNLKADDMKTELQKAASSAENEDSDCFVLVISTHGEEIRVEKGTGLSSAADVWKHAVLAEDKGKVFVEDIVDMFNDDKAPGLAGKPKLFFIQACRSRGSRNKLISISHPKYDQGHQISVEEEKIASLSNFKTIKRYFTCKLRRKKKTQQKHWIYADVDVTNEYNILYKDWKDPDELKGKDDKSAVETRNGNNADSDIGGYSTDEYSEDDDGTIDDNDTSDDEDALKMEQRTNTSKETVEEDASASAGRGSEPLPQSSDAQMPTTPFDVVPINCPNDCLIMYPVMPGKSSFRYPSGSYLLQCLHKGENVSQLINRGNILQYLTSVSQNMAMHDFLPDLIMKSETKEYKMEKLRGWMESNIKHLSRNKELLTEMLGEVHKEHIQGDESLVEEYLKKNIGSFAKKEMRQILRGILPFKMTACSVHRLRDSVSFRPKSEKSPMAKLQTFIETLN